MAITFKSRYGRLFNPHQNKRKMKKYAVRFFSGKNLRSSLLALFLFIACGFAAKAGNTNSLHSMLGDTLTEKKVDYLELIYFSGKNKQELSGYILAVLQQMESKNATTAVAMQYTFLSGIKDKVESSKNACEVLEMIANGIYAIDANEAIQMGIAKPKSDGKGSINAAEALSSLSTLNSTTNNMAWQSWVLSGGKTTGTTMAIAGTTNKVANTLAVADQATQMIGQGSKVLKGFGLGGGDKPCKEVPVKMIAIGDHTPQPTAVTTSVGTSTPSGVVNTASPTQAANNTENSAGALRITVKNISYKQFSSLASNLEKATGITAVNSDDFSSNVGTLVVTGNLRTKDVVEKIMQGNPSIALEIENTSATGASLLVKSKK